MVSTHPATSTTTTQAIQYDLSMAIYAFQKAMSRLPPEIESPLTFAIMDFDLSNTTYTTTLHQDLRAAIFSAELIVDRIAIEGIQDPASSAHEAALSTVTAWNNAVTSGIASDNPASKLEQYAQQTTQASKAPPTARTTAQHHKAPAHTTTQMAQPTHSAQLAPSASQPTPMRSNSVLETGGSNPFYFAFPPSPEEYAHLPKPD